VTRVLIATALLVIVLTGSVVVGAVNAIAEEVLPDW
jgi:hypothetical protein